MQAGLAGAGPAPTACMRPMRVSYTLRTSRSTGGVPPEPAAASSAWKACGVACGAAAAASAPGSGGVPPRLTTSCARALYHLPYTYLVT